MKKLLSFLLLSLAVGTASAEIREIPMLDGEGWWGVENFYGSEMPFTKDTTIRDEFLMGDLLLVAPVLESGSGTREVAIPPGEWTADDGTEVSGPCRISVNAPLSRLPYFTKR